MYSLDDVFNELLEKIRNPEALNPAKSDPIFYFSYPPEMMLALKRSLPRWMSKIREAGFEVRRVSLADILWTIIDESKRWDEWLELEPEADPAQINDSVRDVLQKSNIFIDRVTQSIKDQPQGTVVLLTEAELLHPFFRTRILESYLHDKVKAFTVIFYPGEQSGQFGLRYLGFYPVDPNYRSTIIGGNR